MQNLGLIPRLPALDSLTLLHLLGSPSLFSQIFSSLAPFLHSGLISSFTSAGRLFPSGSIMTPVSMSSKILGVWEIILFVYLFPHLFSCPWLLCSLLHFQGLEEYPANKYFHTSFLDERTD